jgi:hypothetical protein
MAGRLVVESDRSQPNPPVYPVPALSRRALFLSAGRPVAQRLHSILICLQRPLLPRSELLNATLMSFERFMVSLMTVVVLVFDLDARF